MHKAIVFAIFIIALIVGLNGVVVVREEKPEDH